MLSRYVQKSLMMSSELRKMKSTSVTLCICALGGYWPQIEQTVRMRTETILYKDFSKAITWPLERYFDKGLECSDKEVIEQLKSQIVWNKAHPWWTVFEKN